MMDNTLSIDASCSFFPSLFSCIAGDVALIITAARVSTRRIARACFAAPLARTGVPLALARAALVESLSRQSSVRVAPSSSPRAPASRARRPPPRALPRASRSRVSIARSRVASSSSPRRRRRSRSFFVVVARRRVVASSRRRVVAFDRSIASSRTRHRARRRRRAHRRRRRGVRRRRGDGIATRDIRSSARGSS